MASATLIAPPERHAPSRRTDPRRTYSCSECGHVLRVSSVGRHRVYFELDDNQSEDPVMNRVCPVCAHSLPGKNAAGSSS
jgi:rubredoxin